MKIGQLSKATGITTQTIRFYESEGLLPEPPRTQSGYRAYNDDHLERVRFIIKAKRVGLSLDEVRGILQLHDRDEPTCKHVRSLLEQKIAQAERVIKDLQDFTAKLTQLKDEAVDLMDCKPLGGNICAIIEGSGNEVAVAALDLLEPTPGSR